MLRATLKSLLSRKLRLTLAVIAVVLGVMFVSGANVLTDSLSDGFRRLFQTVSEDVAVQVLPTEEAAEEIDPPLLTDEDLETLSQVDGVEEVEGDVSGLNVIPYDSEGEPVSTASGVYLGIGLRPDALDSDDGVMRVSEGRLPEADDEIAITEFTAQEAGLGVGDTMTVYVTSIHSASEYRIVGLLEYSGGRDTLGGETMVVFTEAHGQELFYGQTGVFSGAALYSDGSVSDEQLRDRVAEVLPADFRALTGEEYADEQASDIEEGLSFLNWFFLSFAIVALVVGVFLIFNTFNIVVAQRTRELALFRALGASWAQVTGAVLLEAVIVGVVGSALGLLAGVGIAAGLRAAMESFAFELPEGGLIVELSTVIVGFAVGITVTVISAFIPAIKASSVPPIAAMRDVTRMDKPLRALTITGLCVLLPGVGLIGLSLTGVGSLTLWLLLGGVLLSFLGVALLSPALTRPLAGLVGRLLSWGTASRLGNRNALRNPRRTAVTASALMIGVTLVTTVSVLGSSFQATTTALFDEELGADIIISTNATEYTGEQGFDPALIEEVAALPEVDEAIAVHGALAPVDGTSSLVYAVSDLDTALSIFNMSSVDGQIESLGEREALIDQNTAESNDWSVGDTVSVELPRTGEVDYTIVGIYDSNVMFGLILPQEATAGFEGPLALQGFVSLDREVRDDSERVAQVVSQIEDIMREYPLVFVADQSEYAEQVNRIIDIALAILYVLLALAVVIAVLGIVNTLLLSIYERTRELGMLRAIGMSRRQVKRMIRVESVIMSLFGCLLGIIAGLALGAALTGTLIREELLTEFALPGTELLIFVVIALLAGVAAAWWPAFRASRLKILDAIAYE